VDDPNNSVIIHKGQGPYNSDKLYCFNCNTWGKICIYLSLFLCQVTFSVILRVKVIRIYLKNGGGGGVFIKRCHPHHPWTSFRCLRTVILSTLCSFMYKLHSFTGSVTNTTCTKLKITACCGIPPTLHIHRVLK
jgi:hypothetical protein